MDAREVRDSVIGNRRALSDAIAQVPEERVSEPGLDGGWSVKDVMAHVAWWDLRMCQRVGLPAGLGAGAPEPWPAESNQAGDAWADDINRQVREHYAAAPLAEVRAFYQTEGEAVMSTLEGIDEEHLASGSVLEHAVGRPVLEAIAVDTFEHYPEHEQAIRLFLQGT